MEYSIYCSGCDECTTAKWKILPAYQKSVWYSRNVHIILPKMRVCPECGYVIHSSDMVAQVSSCSAVDYINELNKKVGLV